MKFNYCYALFLFGTIVSAQSLAHVFDLVNMD